MTWYKYLYLIQIKLRVSFLIWFDFFIFLFLVNWFDFFILAEWKLLFESKRLFKKVHKFPLAQETYRKVESGRKSKLRRVIYYIIINKNCKQHMHTEFPTQQRCQINCTVIVPAPLCCVVLFIFI